MITLKDSAHICTRRNIKGLHSCRTCTGLTMRHVYERRAYLEKVALTNRELRHFWLAQKWGEHMDRLRVRGFMD